MGRLLVNFSCECNKYRIHIIWLGARFIMWNIEEIN